MRVSNLLSLSLSAILSQEKDSKYSCSGDYVPYHDSGVQGICIEAPSWTGQGLAMSSVKGVEKMGVRRAEPAAEIRRRRSYARRRRLVSLERPAIEHTLGQYPWKRQ